MDPTAMAGFKQDQLAALDPAAMAGFKADQLGALDPNAMKAFDASKVAFDPTAMAGFKPDQWLPWTQPRWQVLSLTKSPRIGSNRDGRFRCHQDGGDGPNRDGWV